MNENGRRIMSQRLLKKGNYVQIVLPNGNFRYGYISSISKHDMEINIQFYEEGSNKIAYEDEVDSLQGFPSENWNNLLTAREKEIVPLLAAGLTAKEIAENLFCAGSTIRSEIRNLRIKLQLQNKVQLVSYCGGLLKKLKGQ